MTTTQLPKAPPTVPPGCYRNDDGSLGWFDDRGYYNAMCDGWDGGALWEDYYRAFTDIGVGPDNAIYLATPGHCDREHIVPDPNDPWLNPPF
jgi:hypothetical protein